MRSFPNSAMRDGRRWWEEVTVCPIFCTCYEVCLSNSCWWVWISILVRRLLHMAWKIRSSYSPTWAFSLVRVASVCSWNSHNWHASQMPEYPVWMHCFHEKLLHWACQTSLIHLASISLEHKTIFFLAKLWNEFFEISWNEACLHFKRETKTELQWVLNDLVFLLLLSFVWIWEMAILLSGTQWIYIFFAALFKGIFPPTFLATFLWSVCW